MNNRLQSAWLKLEQQRHDIIRLIGKLPEELFLKQPPDRSWSVAEVLTHLITVEHLSLGYMKKKALDWNKAQTAGPGSQIRLGMFILSQRLPLKFKAPAVVVQNTPSTVPLKNTLERWQAVRDEMKEFLAAIPDEHIHKEIYKHPQAGRFTARQALVVFREHAKHHLPQIKRLLKSFSSPAH
ncbi:MAG: DinB family protein [Cyclobacteriaceae bacterium]|nr:DinB family protein [Cyclobacteriaceae bacterium]